MQIAFSNIWNEMQEDLKHLSTHSRRIIAKGSSHYIQIDRPDLLNLRVTEFIEQVRGTPSHQVDYGSTNIE
jgi:pimeloyl-ACP methyl ester carboxylesterase